MFGLYYNKQQLNNYKEDIIMTSLTKKLIFDIKPEEKDIHDALNKREEYVTI
jgi:hypothetical protein